MGNTQSDNREAKIYNGPIKRVPVVKQLYSLVRASVYAMKGDKAEAKWSAKGAVPGWQTCERKIPAMAQREVQKLKGYAVGEVKKQWDDVRPRIINYAVFGVVSLVGFFLWYSQHNVRRSPFLSAFVVSIFVLTTVPDSMINSGNSKTDFSRRWQLSIVRPAFVWDKVHAWLTAGQLQVTVRRKCIRIHGLNGIGWRRYSLLFLWLLSQLLPASTG